MIAALTYLLLPFAVLAHAAGRALGEGRRSDRFLLLSPDLFRLDLASFASLTALLALAATLCALGALALWLAAPLAVGGEAVLGPAFGGELAAALSLLAMGGGGGAVSYVRQIRGLVFLAAIVLFLFGGVPFAAEERAGGGLDPAARLFAAAALAGAVWAAPLLPEGAPVLLIWQKACARFGLLLAASAYLVPFPGKGAERGVFVALLLFLHFCMGFFRHRHPPAALALERLGRAGAMGAALIALFLAVLNA